MTNRSHKPGLEAARLLSLVLVHLQLRHKRVALLDLRLKLLSSPHLHEARHDLLCLFRCLSLHLFMSIVQQVQVGEGEARRMKGGEKRGGERM